MGIMAYRESDVTDDYGIMPWVPIDARVKRGDGKIVVVNEAAKRCKCKNGVYCKKIQVAK